MGTYIYICVYVYICAYICVCMCIYICIWVCLCAYVYTCVSAFKRVYIFSTDLNVYIYSRLILCKGIRLSTTNECPVCDIKQSDGEVSVMPELRLLLTTLSLPSLPGPLWPGMIAPDRVQSTSQIELNCVDWEGVLLTFKLRTDSSLNCLK